MNLSITEYGQDNPTSLVFLHGLGVSSWMWYDQVEDLQNEYHLITIDLPGNAESYQIEWKSFTDTAHQLASIIRDKAHGGRAHIIGLSLGGYSAIHLLQYHPEVVESMIVSGVTTRPFNRQGLWRVAMKFLSRAMGWSPLISLSAKMMQLPTEFVPLYKRDSKRLTPATIQRIYAEVLNFTLPQSIGNCPHRLLAVAGDKEAGLVKDSLPDFPTIMPTAMSALVPNAHHGWNGEHPNLFTEMLRAWVENMPVPDELMPVT